jgi:abortive infection bacteriophage resistance protein
MKIEVSLISNKGNRYFTQSLMYTDDRMWLISEMFSTEVEQKIKTHILCEITFFPKIMTFIETMRKRNVQPDRPQMTIWCMHIACWITKATDTHSEFVIIAFPWQQ